MSSARNHGLREAKGEYITFLDSDDWLEDDAVEVLVETQLKYPDKLITSGFYNVDSDYNKSAGNKANDDIISMNIEEAVNLWRETCMQYVWGKLFQSAVISKYNLNFRENINYGEDAVFTFYYLQASGGAAYINKFTVNYLHRDDNATGLPYEKRKHFEDYPQLMIDHPANTPEIIEKLKLYHTRMFKWELYNALRSRASADEIKYLQSKTHLYLWNYFFHDKASIKGKIILLVKVFAPVTVIRALLKFKPSR